MGRYELADTALTDIDAIIGYIAEERPSAARRILDDLIAAFERIATFPQSGMRSEYLPASDQLIVPVGPYLVVYRPTDFGAAIARVIHGRRDLGAAMGEVDP